jgi:hypothetical protein
VSVSHLPTTSLQATESLMTMESTKPVHLIGELDIYSCIEPTLVDFAPENKRIYGLLEQKKRKKEKERKYTESYKYVSHSRKTYSLSVPLSLHRWRSMEMKRSFIFVLATLDRLASLESMLMTKNLTDFISSSCFQSPYNSTRPSKCFGNMVFNTTFLQLVWYHLWEQ